MKLNGRPVNLEQLHTELVAAAVPHRGLGTMGDDLHTYTATGVIADLPAIAASVVAAHVPAPDPNAAARTAVLTAAQSAEGVTLANLTAVQVRALLACLLQEQGALNPDTTVKPLAQWVK